MQRDFLVNEAKVIVAYWVFGDSLSLMTLRRYLSFVETSKLRGLSPSERTSSRSRFHTEGFLARRKNILLIKQAVVSDAAMKACIASLRSWTLSVDFSAIVSSKTGRGPLLSFERALSSLGTRWRSRAVSTYLLMNR